MSAPSRSQNNPQLTFGVEIECLIPWLYLGQRDPHENVKGLSPVLRLNREELQGYYGHNPLEEAAGELIHERLREILNQTGLNSTLTSTGLSGGISSDVLQNYLQWDVESDSTVVQTDSLGYERNLPNKYPGQRPVHQWVSIELKSPVEYTTPKAFEAIKYALNLLTRKYRMRVNPTCSVHVHVGQGGDRLPLQQIRRIAGLSWAADLLLFTLQPPLRRANTWCKPIREFSNLANGSTGDPEHAREEPLRTSNECLRYLGREVRHGEESILYREQNKDNKNIEAFERTRQPGHYEPFYLQDNEGSRLDPSNNDDQTIVERITHLAANPPQQNSTDRHESARTRNLAKIILPRYTDVELKQLADRLEELTGSDDHQDVSRRPRGNVGVFEGVRQIFEAQSSCIISELLTDSVGTRGSINFNGYSCRSITRDRQGKRTIEFRIGEGCLDDEWVSTWARIVVGLVDFAIFAPVDEYLKVLTRCDLASYDVLDLLDDLGLFAEAEIAEKRISDKSKEWGTRFVN